MGFFNPMLLMFPTIFSNTLPLRSWVFRTSMRSTGIRAEIYHEHGTCRRLTILEDRLVGRNPRATTAGQCRQNRTLSSRRLIAFYCTSIKHNNSAAQTG
jgi:hypothetical protein